MDGINDTGSNLRRALKEAVMQAISEVGLGNFRKTSLFMSNRRDERGGSPDDGATDIG